MTEEKQQAKTLKEIKQPYPWMPLLAPKLPPKDFRAMEVVVYGWLFGANQKNRKPWS